jgi:hypothetical protein
MVEMSFKRRLESRKNKIDSAKPRIPGSWLKKGWDGIEDILRYNYE